MIQRGEEEVLQFLKSLCSTDTKQCRHRACRISGTGLAVVSLGIAIQVGPTGGFFRYGEHARPNGSETSLSAVGKRHRSLLDRGWSAPEIEFVSCL